MGAGNNFPPTFRLTPEMAKWYATTPKWKLAEMLLQYAMLKECTGPTEAFVDLQRESQLPFYSQLV